MSRPPDAVDGRSARDIADDVGLRRTGYVPEWVPRAGAPGNALLGVFAEEAAVLAQGLDALPARAELAFLDAIGTQLLPAQPARVPVVFVLQETAPFDVLVPANTKVAADVAPPPPSPLQRAPAGKTLVFATEGSLLATRAKLASVYSVDPTNDVIADHSSAVTSGFVAFDDMIAAEHALYIGHDELLELKGAVELLILIEVASKVAPASEQLSIAWEYYTAFGWFPFDLLDDQTEGLRRNGTVALRRDCGPDLMKATFGGRTSFWIRGRLSSPLRTEPGGDVRAPVTLDLVQLRVRFARSEVVPAHLFHESSRLDPQSDFEPFGAVPRATTSFHVASKEAFERPLARVRLVFEMSQAGADDGEGDPPVVSWDFHDGTRWRSLDDHEVIDDTDAFTKDGSVSFWRPEEWKEAALHGESSLWLRARLVEGDYGHPIEIAAVSDGSGGVTLETKPATVVAPRVSRLALGYAYVTEPTVAGHCLTYNDFAFTDVTEASQWRRSPFEPFAPLADRTPALYFGFDRALEPGLASMYVHVASEPDDVLGDASELEWEYLSARGWLELSVLDETAGLRRSGMIQWIGPPDMAPRAVVGGERYLLRARLKRGARVEPLALGGIWLNATWASQREVIDGDILGHAAGRPGETFDLLRRAGAILDRVEVEVREWAGSGRDWASAVTELPADAVRLVTDPATGDVSEAWVRWTLVDHFHASGPNDRHFVVERSRAAIVFGDGTRGMAPPVGARVAASYDSGGGVAGNVPALAIERVQGIIPFVAEAFNPVDAAGGAEIESIVSVAQRGSQRLRHAQRAVCEADYEWLAREASPAVKRARCEGLLGPDGRAQRGWVTVRIVPDGDAAAPQPAPALLRRVRDHLARHAAATVAGRIRVLGPSYVAVGVIVEIVPRDPESAALVEAMVRQTVDTFLHPTRGGVRGDGWRFGESVQVSWLALRLEGIDGVDHATRLRLRVDGRLEDERVDVAPDQVVAAGAHEIKLTLEER
jgi:hypothetical protein